MNSGDLPLLLDRLLAQTGEHEWLEFKHNDEVLAAVRALPSSKDFGALGCPEHVEGFAMTTGQRDRRKS